MNAPFPFPSPSPDDRARLAALARDEEAGRKPYLFIRNDPTFPDYGHVNIAAVLREYQRRIEAYPHIHPDTLASRLNGDVQSEQMRWQRETGRGISVVPEHARRELASDYGRLTR